MLHRLLGEVFIDIIFLGDELFAVLFVFLVNLPVQAEIRKSRTPKKTEENVLNCAKKMQ